MYFKFDLDLNLLIGVTWGIVLMKDVFSGQSVFKKIFGLKILDKKTQKPITPLTSITRNFIALPLFPIEVMTFLFAGKRISDWIFKTEVVDTNQMKIKLIFGDLRRYKAIDYFKDYVISFILAVIGANIYVLIWMKLLPSAIFLMQGK